MGIKANLIKEAHLAIKGSGGSFKTKHNHITGAGRFLRTLQDLNLGVQKWQNMTNRHVSAVIEKWKQEGLSVSTIKGYLSGVRTCASFYGARIHASNDAFGIENRV